MIPDIDPPAAPDAVRRSILRPTSFIDKLPPELVTAILELLDVGNLRTAAAVSRIFYQSAWSAGLYLSGSIICSPLVNCESEAALLGDIVQHALLNGRRLRLSLTFIVCNRPPGPEVNRIMSTVSSSLQVLIYLAVSVGPRLLPSIVAALRHPAPSLRELDIHVNTRSGPASFQLPADFLGNAAPRLRYLVVRDLSLGQGAVPAFSHLDSVYLSYDNRFPNIHYALQFPRIRFLHLYYFAELHDPPPAPFDFAGLRLRKLTIADTPHCPLTPAVSRWISISQLPAFEHIGGRLHTDDPLWHEADIGPVSIRLGRGNKEDSGVRIQIVPAHQRWRRTYKVGSSPSDPDVPCPIRELTRLPLGRCLTYLRMANEHLTALLEANWPALDALRHMRIDFSLYGNRAAMVWPPDWSHTLRRAPCAFGPDDVSAPAFAGDSYRYLRCPTLKTLALCCCPGDAALAVESREVAFLGRALGQSARPARERAALILVGVQFKTAVAHDLLDQTFSGVQYHDITGICPTWERDDGVWDEVA